MKDILLKKFGEIEKEVVRKSINLAGIYVGIDRESRQNFGKGVIIESLD
jgi:hypothetical protein